MQMVPVAYHHIGKTPALHSWLFGGSPQNHTNLFPPRLGVVMHSATQKFFVHTRLEYYRKSLMQTRNDFRASKLPNALMLVGLRLFNSCRKGSICSLELTSNVKLYDRVGCCFSEDLHQGRTFLYRCIFMFEARPKLETIRGGLFLARRVSRS